MNRINKKAVIALTAFMFLNSNLYSQENTLTLDECIRKAEVNNSDLRIQKKRVDETRYKYYQQIGYFLPQIDAAAGYTHYDKLNITQKELAGVQKTGERPELNDYTAGLIFNQVIFSGTKYYQLQSAKASYDAESVRFEDIKKRVLFSVKSAYFEQLRSSYMVKAQEELRESIAEQRVITELLYNSGKLTNVDLMKITAQLSAYNDALENLKNLSFTRALMLGQAIGSDEAVYAVMEIPEVEERISVSDACLYNKFRDNAEIAAARELKAKAEFDKKTALSGALPSVSLRGSYYFEDTEFFPGNPNWYVGVAVTMPIFHGGTVYTDIKQSDARYEQAAEALKKTELGVTVKYQAARSVLSDRKNRISTSRKTLELAREVLTATKLKYRTGKVTTIELIDAQITWNNAYTGYINNILDYTIAKAEIESICTDALRRGVN